MQIEILSNPNNYRIVKNRNNFLYIDWLATFYYDL